MLAKLAQALVEICHATVQIPRWSRDGILTPLNRGEWSDSRARAQRLPFEEAVGEAIPAKDGEAIVSILFWLTLIQAIFGGIIMLSDGQANLPDMSTLPWLALIGVAGITAHLCLTTALSLAPASMVVPVDFARLPLIAVVGAVFYAEPIEITLFLGAALIFLGIWINLSGGTSSPQGPKVTKP